MMSGKQCRLVSKSVPARAGLAGEQLKSVPRTGGFYQSVKLIRLARMLAPSSVQDRRVTTMDKHWLAAGRQQTMLRLPAQPLPRALAVLHPRERSLVFESPDLGNLKCSPQVGVRCPQPENSVLLRQILHRHCPDFIE